MNTLPFPSTALGGPRRIVLLAGASALVAALCLTGVRVFQIEASAQNRTIEMSASYHAFASVAALTKQADLVLVGNVVAQGPTRLVAQPKQTPRPFTAVPDDKLPADKAARVKGLLGLPSILSDDPPPPPQDLPVTDYTISVTQVLKGSARTTASITVSQTGGTMELPTFPGGPKLSRTFTMEHDPMMAVGEQHLFFLNRTADGNHFVLGGPQGRFAVDKGGKVHPIDPSTPVARNHVGVSLESVALEVERSAK